MSTRSRQHRVLFLVLAVAIAVLIWHVLAPSFFVLLLIGLGAFLWLRHGPQRHRRL
jgi:Flp pilus assembly protein TadB